MRVVGVAGTADAIGVTGTVGAVGVAGTTGTMGTADASGAVLVLGAVGVTGAADASGFTGTAGAMVTPGDMVFVGAAGTVGFMGATNGTVDTSGFTGAAGGTMVFVGGFVVVGALGVTFCVGLGPTGAVFGNADGSLAPVLAGFVTTDGGLGTTVGFVATGVGLGTTVGDAPIFVGPDLFSGVLGTRTPPLATLATSFVFSIFGLGSMDEGVVVAVAVVDVAVVLPTAKVSSVVPIGVLPFAESWSLLPVRRIPFVFLLDVRFFRPFFSRRLRAFSASSPALFVFSLLLVAGVAAVAAATPPLSRLITVSDVGGLGACGVDAAECLDLFGRMMVGGGDGGDVVVDVPNVFVAGPLA